MSYCICFLLVFRIYVVVVVVYELVSVFTIHRVCLDPLALLVREENPETRFVHFLVTDSSKCNIIAAEILGLFRDSLHTVR